MSGLAVLGGGAFGTALAIAMAGDRPVTLWMRSADACAETARTGQNRRHLPGARLPDSITLSSDLDAIDADCLLLALPTQGLSGFLAANRTLLDGRRLVLCCKGIDQGSGLRPSQVAARHCPNSPVAVLTGPSFAVDIAAGLPTALTLATASDGDRLQRRLACPTLRLYLTDDVAGAELGGALKNVVALAAGLTLGAGLGDSARAAVVTRGFAEIGRFAAHEGARVETLMGLSGLGDLILTCTSEKSRNFAAGMALGRGEALPEGQTIEGLATAQAVTRAAAQRGIDMPLTAMVAAVTEGRLSVAQAASALMARPLKKE